MYYDTKISASVRERKTLDFSLEIKALDEHGRFAGYASVFGVVDNQRDIITSGAFLQSLVNRTHEIKLLWQHQQEEPIGVFDTVFEDERGLYVEGRLLLDVQRAREAYALLKAGAVSGLSIGYSPVRYRMNAETGVRHLLEVDLWEVSLVTFPANEAAGVTMVKSMDTDEEWQRAVSSGEVVDLAAALARCTENIIDLCRVE